MPHCIIEYSKELEKEISPTEMIETTHDGTMASGLFVENHIKSRAIAYEDFRTGEPELRFIHITAKIISGRTIEQKTSLSESIQAQFKGVISEKKLSKISVTVDVRDLQQESYTKTIY